MKKIDLITGFLGAGKTTFIRRYADYLLRQGNRLGILENDYGAVNVDVMLLQELEQAGCGLEAVAGACCADCHRRRFKTKLIALGMSDYDRVLIEPSGVFDVDEFYDALCEPPLDQWYEIGSVIAVADAVPEELSDKAEYLLASQIAGAGKVVLSKTQLATQEQIAAAIRRLNRVMERFGCARRFGDDVLTKPWDELTDADFASVAAAGRYGESLVKRFDAEDFSSVCFLNGSHTADELRRTVRALFDDERCGGVFRVKGFFRDNGWQELNATRSAFSLSPVPNGQEIIIVTGENLRRDAIERYFEQK